MQQAVEARAPAHFRIVGILSLLWNGFGAYGYLMTRMRNTDYLSSMGIDPNVILTWIDGFPLYAQIGWGLGVWGGVLGSVLLLMRSRYALAAYAASLIGMALSFGYQYLGSTMPAGMDVGMSRFMPVVIIVVGGAQLFYARAMKAKGVLR